MLPQLKLQTFDDKADVLIEGKHLSPKIYPDTLSVAQCEELREYSTRRNQWHRGTMRSGVSDNRLCEVLPLSGDETDWLLERMDEVIRRANRHYGFQLDSIETPLQLVRYKSGGHIRPHFDRGSGASARKISFSIQLSTSHEYGGGDLQFAGLTRHPPFMREQGAAVAFPSFMLHEVTSLLEGERCVLVFFACGPAFL